MPAQYTNVHISCQYVHYIYTHWHRYHQWMQDPVLRAQTASEPLTLEQEHDMQQSWLRDDDSKLA